MSKYTTIWLICFIFLIYVLIIESCKKKDTSPVAQLTPLSFIIPEGFPKPTKDIFASNPLTKEGFELGRKLFYDGLLSADGNFPCASCHQQFASFATFDHDLSHGFNNQFTTRNAPPLFNLAWHKEFHWDGGIANLEVQPLAPIAAPNKMAETIENVIRKLNANASYKSMFKQAFNTEVIDSKNMLQALSQFMGMMVSANSKFDKVKRGESSYTAAEQRGYEVFTQHCASCHAEPLFTDLSYRNIGLSLNNSLKDFGRMQITKNPSDSLKFKVPSLRNIFQTAPYGHDGRFFSVGQVIDHYRNGVVNGPTTDPLVRNRINLDEFQKNDLIIFLRTLTDSSFLNDKRFGPY